MDSVRFGKALGMGARGAARAIVQAADAAASPNPNQVRSKQGEQTSTSPGVKQEKVIPGQRAATATDSVRTATTGVRRGSAKFGQAVWRPFVKLSGVLWLEVTGVFFGLFALTAGIGVWKSRADFHTPGVASYRLWFAVLMFVLFGYFTVSSFLRARRRSQG